jgi:tRNA pseudouridine55 synthase
MPLYLNKPIGKTPLEVIQEIHNGTSKYSFAGRLDPMARGLMIVLQDEECKLQDNFCHLDKVYEFTMLLGCQTDTYDVLGLLTHEINSESNLNLKIKLTNLIQNNLSQYTGMIEQYYPPYSSVIVNKKPLWWWSRENKLNKITIPSKKVEIYKLENLGYHKEINSYELWKQIQEKITSLSESRYENFRVPQILDTWDKHLTLLPNKSFILQSFRATVSSGTYIRSLVHRIGTDLNCGALAFDIHRTEFLEKKY